MGTILRSGVGKIGAGGKLHPAIEVASEHGFLPRSKFTCSCPGTISGRRSHRARFFFDGEYAPNCGTRKTSPVACEAVA